MRMKKWIACIAALAVIVTAAVCIPSLVHNARRAASYQEAEALIAQGQYQQAYDLLTVIAEEDYRYLDTFGLRKLCSAHIACDKGNPADAYITLSSAEFQHQSEEFVAEVQAFRLSLKDAYDAERQRKREAEEAEYQRLVQRSVPFVGMRESSINDTILGKPADKVRHNWQVKNGQQYIANLYDFYDGDAWIFSARCVQGKVTEIWDYRSNPRKPHKRRTTTSASSPSDPSVDGFTNPEDFYDWYWYDFFDYYDAEEYYYDHGGE